MKAKELFEELGFQFKEEKDYWENILGEKILIKHEFVYECNSSISFKYSWLDVKFDLLKKNIRFWQNSMNGNNCPPPIGMDLYEVINKQIEELGWNNE